TLFLRFQNSKPWFLNLSISGYKIPLLAFARTGVRHLLRQPLGQWEKSGRSFQFRRGARRLHLRHRGVRQTFLPIASPELHVAIQIPVPELFRCRAIVRLFWLIWGLILILKPLFRPNAQLLWNAVINFDRMKNGISSALRFLPNLCV